jgi:hypothetical protein
MNASKKSELSAIEGSAMRGNPMVAVNDRSVLVSFAARDSAQSAWGIRLAIARHGENPASSRAFAPANADPAASLTSPVAAGLSGGRWLLQWTEASSGCRQRPPTACSYQVRVQVLNADLEPIAEPITVSPAGMYAGQGVVWIDGENAVAMFIVSQAKNRELWGAALKCP